ncbi:MAG: hypothetical protein AAF351_00945 [Pseudomonadota bacterium]
MSMELFVLFAAGSAPDLQAWKAALAERNAPVSIIEEVDLSTHSGFLPMRLEDKDTGLYFLIEDFDELAVSIPALKEVSMEDPVVYSLSFGGHMDEGAVAFYSAFALTAELGGIAFETQSGEFMSGDKLFEAAKQLHQLAAQQ